MEKVVFMTNESAGVKKAALIETLSDTDCCMKGADHPCRRLGRLAVSNRLFQKRGFCTRFRLSRRVGQGLPMPARSDVHTFRAMSPSSGLGAQQKEWGHMKSKPLGIFFAFFPFLPLVHLGFSVPISDFFTRMEMSLL